MLVLARPAARLPATSATRFALLVAVSSHCAVPLYVESALWHLCAVLCVTSVLNFSTLPLPSELLPGYFRRKRLVICNLPSITCLNRHQLIHRELLLPVEAVGDQRPVARHAVV